MKEEKQRAGTERRCNHTSLETVVVLLVLFALPLKAVVPVAVVAAALAAVAHVEAGVHLRQRVHAQNLVDLPEGQEPQGKLWEQRQSADSRGRCGVPPGRDLTWALEVMSSLCCSPIDARVSTGFFSQGSSSPGPPG